MKKLSSILPILALLLAVAGAVAMKPAPKNQPVLTYYFTGPVGGEFNPDNYDTDPPTGGCSGTTLACEVQVPNGYSSIEEYMTWLNQQSNKEELFEAQVVTKRD
ncbi:MAG: hypothetical protein EPO58_02270 [Chitinophagaceae bacterium]|nr:MAG: hypothetical protein EPO58_02270 [Chitinophagaceae bacterium]